MRGITKVRQNLYLDRKINDALEALAAGPGGNKSHLVNAAVADWLARQGSKAIDDLLKVRLDRMSREQQRIARDVNIVIEGLALFVHYYVSVNAQLPAADHVARAVGRARFAEFVEVLGKQLASGKRTFGTIDTEDLS
ncbi:CopG family transcriptional regulator [soil metagenome]